MSHLEQFKFNSELKALHYVNKDSILVYGFSNFLALLLKIISPNYISMPKDRKK